MIDIINIRFGVYQFNQVFNNGSSNTSTPHHHHHPTKPVDDSIVQRIARVSAARQQPNYGTGKASRTLPSIAVINPLLAGHKTYSDLLETVNTRSTSGGEVTRTTSPATTTMSKSFNGHSPSSPFQQQQLYYSTGSRPNTSSSARNRSKSPFHISRMVKNAKPIPVIGPFGVKQKVEKREF